MSHTRLVEFEGGPWDGKRTMVRTDMIEVFVPMRGTFMLNPSALVIPPMRKGIYVPDPLDDHTLLWKGEKE